MNNSDPISQIVSTITDKLPGIKPKQTWGETALFYNPENKLPNGVYFCTLKNKDGDNDKSSNLNRDHVFRISLGIGKAQYIELFGKQPKRPAKGMIIDSEHDFSATDILMPHPIYGWMSWVQILSPSQSTFDSLWPLIETSYQNAVTKYELKLAKS